MSSDSSSSLLRVRGRHLHLYSNFPTEKIRTMAVFPRAANALVKVLMLASSTRAFTSCVRSSSRGGYQHSLNSDTVQTWVNNDLHLRQKLDSPENFRGQNAFIFKLPFMFVSSSSGTFFTKRYMTSSSPSSEQDSVVSTCRKKIWYVCLNCLPWFL